MNSLYHCIVFIVLLLCVSSTECSAWYRLVAKNGGHNGYNIVVTMSDGWGTSIWCEGAGYEKCPTEARRSGIFSRRSYIDSKDQEAANFAMDQMRKGIKEGNFKMSSGRTVRWKRTATEIYVSVD